MAKRPRGIHRLDAKQIERLPQGLHPDGGGLYLQVKGGSRSWLFRTRDNWKGLSATHTVSLNEARDLARECRKLMAAGIDPLEADKAKRLDAELEKAKDKTFRQVAEEWLARKSKVWKPANYKKISDRIALHVYAKLGNLPIQRFDLRKPGNSAVDLIDDVLEPLWHSKTPTGGYIQGDIQRILGWAIAKNYIAGENAASMKGALGVQRDNIKDFYRSKHHAALPWQEIGQFMAKLRATRVRIDNRCKVCFHSERDAIEAAKLASGSMYEIGRQFRISGHNIHYHMAHHMERRPSAVVRRPDSTYCFEFLILTAVRKGQARTARWAEIDMENKLWVCSRHKTREQTGLAHVIPLSDAAMAVLHTQKEIQAENGIKDHEFVFHGEGYRGHIGQVTLNKCLTDVLGRPYLTVHGFRTSFGSWSVENGYDERDSEMALAHMVGDTVRQIYKRQALRIEPRRLMMQAWAEHCARTEPLPGSVIQFRAAK